MFYHLYICSAGSHLASRFGTSLLVRPRDQPSVTRNRTVRCRCLCHSLEQGDGLALGPPPSDSLSDWQRGQRIGESIGRLHGTPVGLGGRHWKNLQVLREGNYRGKQHGAQMCLIMILYDSIMTHMRIANVQSIYIIMTENVL